MPLALPVGIDLETPLLREGAFVSPGADVPAAKWIKATCLLDPADLLDPTAEVTMIIEASTDGGKTWEEACSATYQPGREPDSRDGLFHDPNQTIFAADAYPAAQWRTRIEHAKPMTSAAKIEYQPA